jgi:hypothetical protein
MLLAFLSNTPPVSLSNVKSNQPVSPLDSSLLVRANEGRRLHAFGDTLVILFDGKQTGETFTAFLSISPPGGGAGPHYHDREDEWFYIIEARVSFSSMTPGLSYRRVIAFIPLAGRSTLSKTIPISLPAS